MNWVSASGVIEVPEEEKWIAEKVIEQFDESGVEAPESALDIGAHIGSLSAYLAVRYGTTVFAYEPYEPNFKSLKAVLDKNFCFEVTPVWAAVGDILETRTLRQVGVNSGQIGYQFDEEFPEEHDTQVLPLSDVIHEAYKEAGTLDLMKMDVEGAEYEMLYPGCAAEQALTEMVQNVQIDIHEIHHPQFMCDESRIPDHYKPLPKAPEFLVEYLRSIGFKDDQKDHCFTSRNHGLKP